MNSQFVEESRLHVNDGAPATHPHNDLGAITSFGVDVVEVILRSTIRIRTNELLANIVHAVHLLQTNLFPDRKPGLHRKIDGNTLKEGLRKRNSRQKTTTYDAVATVEDRVIHIGQRKNIGRFQLTKNIDRNPTLTKKLRRDQDLLKKGKDSMKTKK